jgi:hypothetical protein
MRAIPVEIVVTVVPDGPRWTGSDPPAVAAAAADAVDALLWPQTLRGRGFRLLSVERIEPAEEQP